MTKFYIYLFVAIGWLCPSFAQAADPIFQDTQSFKIAKAEKMGALGARNALFDGKGILTRKDTDKPKRLECVRDKDCKKGYQCNTGNTCEDKCLTMKFTSAQTCFEGEITNCARGTACKCPAPQVADGKGNCFNPCSPNPCGSTTPVCTQSAANYSCACTASSCPNAQTCSSKACVTCCTAPANGYCSGCTATCNSGYTMEGGSCKKNCVAPSNGYCSSVTAIPACNSGYTMQSNGTCKKDCTAPTNGYCLEDVPTCNSGFTMVGTTCVSQACDPYSNANGGFYTNTNGKIAIPSGKRCWATYGADAYITVPNETTEYASVTVRYWNHAYVKGKIKTRQLQVWNDQGDSTTVFHDPVEVNGEIVIGSRNVPIFMGGLTGSYTCRRITGVRSVESDTPVSCGDYLITKAQIDSTGNRHPTYPSLRTLVNYSGAVTQSHPNKLLTKACLSRCGSGKTSAMEFRYGDMYGSKELVCVKWDTKNSTNWSNTYLEPWTCVTAK